ncbi:TMV resistance protein N-like [Solanum tuberosum]|uniref:TMV resistance protein N-like n=1 Tax=Solanum tuberosum TaxID=4113 RepID=UPI00073A0058|nr:PREDICTED: TMV resistance protein N-like [Solanum tuberosum]
MAFSSSFASNSQDRARWKYDVFLSFSGYDTRRTFTSHLHEGLKNRGIFTFLDERVDHGNSISEELVKGIEESQVAVIVFSKNYAKSRLCLNELVKIMKCKVENGQIVIPVFYDVNPSYVRRQIGSFAKAFAKHECRYMDDVEGMQKVQGWRTALAAATDLRGYEIYDRTESECIRELVDDVSSKLCKTSSSYLQDIVGIDTHLEKVKSLLEMETNDVRIVGIWGMGGVGKTTIARVVFDTLSPQFQGASFLADFLLSFCKLGELFPILLEFVNFMHNC